jgi:VanZ family protein
MADFFPPSPADNRSARLFRYLALAYTLLIIYASLHPFSGWRASGVSPVVFFSAEWPYYWSVFDLVFNALAYTPLGFLVTQALQHQTGVRKPVLLSLLFGTCLSFGLEALQTYLPSRVPSNLDLACNVLGAALGALLARWQGERLIRHIAPIQKKLLVAHPQAELGLVLVVLWLLTQLSPETIAFSTGDLRRLLEIKFTASYAAPSFFALETSIIVCHTIAIGLLVSSLLLATNNASRLSIVIFFGFAVAIRTLATAILVSPAQAFAWLTPGARLGLMVGAAALFLIRLLLPSASHIALAGLALMAGTTLVNLVPPNPYSTIAMSTWNQGHFLNFNGLTRLTASLWPFLVLPYLTTLGRRR